MLTTFLRRIAFVFAVSALLGLPVLANAQTAAPSAATNKASAIFAGGCFWCIEKDFEKLQGVIEVESGYTAGKTTKPTYEQVSAGRTGHTEAVRVHYDPSKVSYAQLVEYFWRHIDPTVKDQQFCDHGTQYRSGIYWQNPEERKAVESSLEQLKKSGRFQQIHTEIAPASTFGWPKTTTKTTTRKTPCATTTTAKAAAAMRV